MSPYPPLNSIQPLIINYIQKYAEMVTNIARTLCTTQSIHTKLITDNNQLTWPLQNVNIGIYVDKII